jgi:hypothetical protein
MEPKYGPVGESGEPCSRIQTVEGILTPILPEVLADRGMGLLDRQ